jgi:hypothetical protein
VLEGTSTATSTLRIVLSRSITITGRVQPVGLVGFGFRFVLEKRETNPQRAPLSMRADGTFVATTVESGTYDVLCVSGNTVVSRAARPLVVPCADGETPILRFPHLEPGRLLVLQSGATGKGPEVEVRRASGPPTVEPRRGTLIDGRCEIDRLLPGEYEVRSPGMGGAQGAILMKIQPGETTKVFLDKRRR